MKYSFVVLLIGAAFTSCFAEVDVVLQDFGCWKEKISDPLIESWEKQDSTLQDMPTDRTDAIQRCAKVAKKHGFKMFAIRDNGICATGPLVEHRFKKHGPSINCAITGRGGWEANQVYMINTIIDANFVPVGCFKTELIKDLIRLEKRFVRLSDDWHTRVQIEEKCARAAAAVGLEVFALHDGGECFGWKRSVKEVYQYTRSYECGPRDLGTKTGVKVYEFLEQSNVTIVNLGCWKINPKSRALPLVESRSDLLGERDHRIRKHAVEKCAIYNANSRHEFFALTDGGACAAAMIERPAYDELGPSDKCTSDGKGAKDADQVYKIIRDVKTIKKGKWDSCIPYLTPLGCWSVKDVELIPTLEGTDPLLADDPLERFDALMRCGKVAQKRGLHVIALREGRCFSSPDARKLYKSHGPSNDCDPEIGAPDAISVFEVNTVLEPWFSNEGCFDGCQEVQLLEGLHPFLEDSPQTRTNPVKKCAKVAALWDFDSFAIANGGICHGLWWNTTKNCVRSAACNDDGLGGRFSLQIYSLKAKNNFTIENLGCWHDHAFRAIPVAEGASLELTGRFTEREDALGACARYARSRGFKVFALQAGGMCLTSEHAEERFNWYGWSNDCDEVGTGGQWSNQVWRISDDWWKSPVDWWKVPEHWQNFGGWNCTWQWWKTPIAPKI